jgi:hypothetical protein
MRRPQWTFLATVLSVFAACSSGTSTQATSSPGPKYEQQVRLLRSTPQCPFIGLGQVRSELPQKSLQRVAFEEGADAVINVRWVVAADRVRRQVGQAIRFTDPDCRR